MEKILKVGEEYEPGVLIKSITKTNGFKMPTKAYYDNGKTIQSTDQLYRVVLDNGMIRYVKINN